MLEDQKISYKSIVGIIILGISPSAILYLPTITYKEANQDCWLSILVVTLFGILSALIITSLGKLYQNKTVIDYSVDILGWPLGKLIGLVYILFFIYIDATILREFSELLSGAFLINTPQIFFSIGILLPCIYMLYIGIESLARASQILFPLYLVSVVGLILLAMNEMDFNYLKPVLAEGIEPVLMGSYRNMVWFGEISILLILFPSINQTKQVKKLSVLAIIVVSLLLMIVNISLVSIFSNHIDHLNYPFLSLARFVSVGGFVERLDSVIMIMWIAVMFIKISLFFYCAMVSISKFFNIKKSSNTIFPLAIIIFFISFLRWDSLTALKSELAYQMPIPYTIIQVGIPFLLLIIAKLKQSFSTK
jgi:spore germination protein KB